MEGIAVKNFDNRTMYAVSCFALNTWMVTLQAIIDQFEYCDESKGSHSLASYDFYLFN